jgi:hypothetical protein
VYEWENSEIVVLKAAGEMMNFLFDELALVNQLSAKRFALL